jgi:hypothetical protein
MVKFNCENCNDEFKVTPFRATSKKYKTRFCSMICRSQFGTKSRICKQCSKPFVSKMSGILRGWGNFCSRRCAASSTITSFYKPCECCGKKFKAAAAQAKKGWAKFCSVKCRAFAQIKPKFQRKCTDMLATINRCIKLSKKKDTQINGWPDKRIGSSAVEEKVLSDQFRVEQISTHDWFRER